MLPAIESKLPRTGTTIFTVMSQLAQQHGAVNLGQGFPDYPMDEGLVEAVSRAMQEGQNQYAHMCGLPLLRQRIAEKVNRHYGCAVDGETDITITPGGTYALYTALTTLIRPGDEVIVFEPAYDSYIPNIEINGGRPVILPLEFPGYRINWDHVRAALTPRTRAILINTPHNPTGQTLSESDRDQLRKLTEEHPLVVISDEVYEHLIFGGARHHSVLADPVLRQRSIACFSFGKVFDCTGWKMGYAIAPAYLMTEFRKVHQFNAFTCHTPTQAGIAETLERRELIEGLGLRLERRKRLLEELLADTPLRPLPSYGSYFQLYSYSDISLEPEDQMAVRLVKEAGVATIPVSAFYREPVHHGVLRFCFAKKEETLEEAAGRLRRFFSAG